MALGLVLQGVFVAGAALLCIHLLGRYLLERRRVYPPGPRGIPFFGSFFSLILGGRSQNEVIQDWTKQYGAIFTFKLLGTRVYILNDAKLIQEAFADSPHLSGRASFTAFDTILGRKNIGVGFSNGDVWKEQHRFFLNFFRKGSSGILKLEGFVQAHAEKLVAEIGGHDGAAFDPWDLLNIYVAINVAKVVTGVTYESDDEELRALNRTVNRLFDVMGPAGLMSCVPLLSSIPSPVKTELMELCTEIDGFVRRAIDAHQTGVDLDNEARHVDLIGHYLKEMATMTAQGNPGSFDLTNLRMTCVDALAPGQENATTVLQWLFFTLALHPDAQGRVREEIFDVVGTDRIPSYYKDHHAMPITLATITECMRLRPAIWLHIPHLATEDCKVAGYDVPRDSAMVANLSHLALSPTLWSDPAEFRPERFLDERGNLDLTNEPFPFGHGRRSCPGEGLARMEIFIFITSILQHFTLSLPEGAPRTNVGKPCLTYRPDPYQIQATRII